MLVVLRQVPSGLALFIATGFKPHLLHYRIMLVCLLSNLMISSHAQLKVSDNGRHLVEAVNNQPFFYLGDTAWELFNRLNRDEVIHYLDNRKRRGFTVIQAVALAEFGGLAQPNAHGDTPFLHNDPLTPNLTPGADPVDSAQYDYWDHVDFIIGAIEARGMKVGLLPCWGTYVYKLKTINAANAQAYGHFFGRRYQTRKNIIWILGGDERGKGEFKSVWDALAKGIAMGINGREDYSNVLMSFHPDAYFFSSVYYHDTPWLDFNMIQSAHFEDRESWRFLQMDYGKLPTKPCLDAESLYEDHPMQRTDRYSTDYNLRKSNYWNLFAGATGVVYGHAGIWQFYAPGRKAIAGARTYWYDALNHPGAAQLQHLQRIVKARPAFFSRQPDQSLLSEAGEKGDHCQAILAADRSYLMVYFPKQTISQVVKASRLTGSLMRAWWFNPRDGRCYAQNGQLSRRSALLVTKSNRSFTPPASDSSSDWVLILDDDAKKYGRP